MRAAFGILSLLVVLAAVGLLAKKQLSGVSAARSVSTPGAGSGASTAGKIQQQVLQAVEGAMQQPRPMPESE